MVGEVVDNIVPSASSIEVLSNVVLPVLIIIVSLESNVVPAGGFEISSIHDSVDEGSSAHLHVFGVMARESEESDISCSLESDVGSIALLVSIGVSSCFDGSGKDYILLVGYDSKGTELELDKVLIPLEELHHKLKLDIRIDLKTVSFLVSILCSFVCG